MSVVEGPSATRSKPKRKISHDAPVGGGANFVDVDLRVVVKQARGTLMIFKPDHRHGTTIPCGAVNHAVTAAFSQRVVDAKLLGQIVSVSGAGEGNYSM